MKTFIMTALATAFANTISFLLYQGFVKSYWGKNCREEVSRIFNSMSKHMRKIKKNKGDN